MNTDVRLAAVNEIFIEHSVILGITDVLDGPRNILQVSFLLGIGQIPPALQVFIAVVIQRLGFLGSASSPMGWHEELGSFYFSCEWALRYAQR